MIYRVQVADEKGMVELVVETDASDNIIGGTVNRIERKMPVYTGDIDDALDAEINRMGFSPCRGCGG